MSWLFSFLSLLIKFLLEFEHNAGWTVVHFISSEHNYKYTFKCFLSIIKPGINLYLQLRLLFSHSVIGIFLIMNEI